MTDAAVAGQSYHRKKDEEETQQILLCCLLLVCTYRSSPASCCPSVFLHLLISVFNFYLALEAAPKAQRAATERGGPLVDFSIDFLLTAQWPCQPAVLA